MVTTHPTSTWLNVNRSCNFRCKWCYASGTQYDCSKAMTFDLAKELSLMSYGVGVNNFILIGGEPTLWPELFNLNSFLAGLKNIRTVLVTNGMRFCSDRFWYKYLEYPNTNIGLSLKAGTPEQLKNFAGITNFGMMRRGIERACEQFKATVSITYNSFYTDCLVDLVKFAVDCGASSVKIDFCSTVFKDGVPDSRFMVNPLELASNIVRDYTALDKVTNGKIVFELMVPFCIFPMDFIQDLKEHKRILSVCHVHKKQGLIFDETGNLIMCNGLFDYPLAKYGSDFTDTESLQKVLDNPLIIEYYNRIGCYPDKSCADCVWYGDCAGGCPLRWAVYKPSDIIRPLDHSRLERR